MKYSQKIYILIGFVFFLTTRTFAQSSFLYNFYHQNQMVYNPSAVGQDEGANVFVNYRQQWTGFDGAPKTAMIGAQGSYGNSGGIGILVMSNTWGVFNDNLIKISNAYRLKLSHHAQLAMGISLGVQARQVDYKRLTVEQLEEDDVLNSRLNALSNDWAFTSGFGMTYKRENLVVGLSAPELYDTREGAFLQTKMAYLSYQFEREMFKIIPSTLVKVVKNSPTQFDINLQGMWNDLIWVQPTYRSNKSVILSTGINYENIRFGYAFEMAGSSTNINNNTHEIMLAIQFKKKDKNLKPISESTTSEDIDKKADKVALEK
jgi:type IX secretion system PorP/SprF family membrane protein